MKKLLLSLNGKFLIILSLLAIVWSCKPSVTPEPDITPEFVLAASVDFGCKSDELISSQEAAGNVPGEFDEATRTLRVTTKDTVQTEVLYYFDGDDSYRYALISVKSFGHLDNEYFQMISDAGWKSYGISEDFPGYEQIFSKGDVLMRVFSEESAAQNSAAILVGPADESIFSWSRTDVLEDPATGVFTPLTAFGASLDLVRKFEFLQGHTVNEERTNPDNQFYAFNTGNEKFPMMGYWFDIATDTFLEECALYIEPDSRPTPDEINTYVTGLGLEYSYLADGNGNPIFYDKNTMTVCCAEMNEPETGVFSPKLRFYIQDLSEYLPKETVVIPWPNMDFGKITMDEAIEWYEAQGFDVNPTGFMEVFPLVETKQEDFNQIILFPDDNNNYAGAYVMTPDIKVIKSPDIERQLIENGFEEVDSSILTTFHNEQTNVEAQIDLSAMFGAYAIGFNLIGA